MSDTSNDNKIPIGFSNNDFFYKSVNTINIEGNVWGIGTDPNDICSQSESNIKYLISSYYNNLKINLPTKPSTDKFTNIGIKDNAETVSFDSKNINKDEIVNKMVEYYLAICKNKNLASELILNNGENENGKLQYEDTVNTYNREYLNRINLGIGLILTTGILFFITSIPKNTSIPLSK
jgi:hypothetical protein